MAPIHPTAPTSSFSSSYCWYWSPVPRCWHEVSMLRMHGFATPGGSSHLILKSEVQSRASVALAHLCQDQKSVRRGSKAGRLGDGFSFFLGTCHWAICGTFFILLCLSKVAILLPLMRNFLLCCRDIPKGFLQTISSLNYQTEAF
jgi:hypothetical protein